MSEKLETEILGKDVEFEYAEHWVGYSLLAMRIGMGWLLFQAGIQKLINPAWTAAGYLQNAPAGNPLQFLWTALASEPFIGTVNILVVAGLTLTGFGLILGAFMRLNAFFASAMMLMFYTSSLKGGLLQGLPVAHGWVIDSHIVYIILIIASAEFGSGRILGLDQKIEQMEFIRNYPWIKRFLTG